MNNLLQVMQKLNQKKHNLKLWWENENIKTIDRAMFYLEFLKVQEILFIIEKNLFEEAIKNLDEIEVYKYDKKFYVNLFENNIENIDNNCRIKQALVQKLRNERYEKSMLEDKKDFRQMLEKNIRIIAEKEVDHREDMVSYLYNKIAKEFLSLFNEEYAQVKRSQKIYNWKKAFKEGYKNEKNSKL